MYFDVFQPNGKRDTYETADEVIKAAEEAADFFEEVHRKDLARSVEFNGCNVEYSIRVYPTLFLQGQQEPIIDIDAMSGGILFLVLTYEDEEAAEARGIHWYGQNGLI